MSEPQWSWQETEGSAAALIQQLALIDTLLSNWDEIRECMAPLDPALDRELAAIALRLATVKSSEEAAVVVDDLLDITMDTPAHDLVRGLVARSSLGGVAVRGSSFEAQAGDPAAVTASTLARGAAEAVRSLATAIQPPAPEVPFAVPVFFATNRRRAPAEGSAQDYGPEPDGELRYGEAQVTIPLAAHRMGKVETPRWWRRLLGQREEQRFQVRVTSLCQAKFVSRLSQAFQAEEERELLVFVHGYNVTFREALRRCAQLAFDLQFPGAVVLFSWPSMGSVCWYTADEERAAASADQLAALLRLLEGGPWRKVHLLAHSMGNRVVVLGLADNPPSKLPLRQVVLAAADVNVEIFRQKFPRIAWVGLGFTSYASKSDRALLLSAGLHQMSRVGFIQGEPFVTEGLVTVDASPVDSGLLGLGHGYVYGRRSVLTDVGLLLREGLPAGRRGLRESHLQLDPRKSYWSFPL